MDNTFEEKLDKCPHCGGTLDILNTETHQQITVHEKPFIVNEYIAHKYWCPHCNTYHETQLPEETKTGLFSNKLITLVAYLKGRCHVSYTALQDFFKDVLGIKICRGFLVKQVKKAAKAMENTYDKLVNQLSKEKHLHIDESGWKENGEKCWGWVFKSVIYAVFYITHSRSESVLEEMLGKGFEGIISCNFYGAYKKFKRLHSTFIQFCWAHFIREILFIQTIHDKKVVHYWKEIIKQIELMFATVNQKESMNIVEWKTHMHKHQKALVRSIKDNVPNNHEVELIANRIRKWEADYFRFIDNDIEPTNNPAERTIRGGPVLDRIVTQGTCSQAGNEWHERFWDHI